MWSCHSTVEARSHGSLPSSLHPFHLLAALTGWNVCRYELVSLVMHCAPKKASGPSTVDEDRKRVGEMICQLPSFRSFLCHSLHLESFMAYHFYIIIIISERSERVVSSYSHHSLIPHLIVSYAGMR